MLQVEILMKPGNVQGTNSRKAVSQERLCPKLPCKSATGKEMTIVELFPGFLAWLLVNLLNICNIIQKNVDHG